MDRIRISANNKEEWKLNESIRESKKSLYQLLLQYLQEYQNEPLQMQGGLALILLKNVVITLQSESEQTDKDFEYLEGRLDKTNKIITLLIRLFEFHASQTTQTNDFLHDLDELKKEQKELIEFKNRFGALIRNRVDQLNQDKEKIKNGLPGIG